MMQETVQNTPDDRAMGFTRVEGGTETTSAALMLVLAYLVMWVILIGFVWLSWRKLGRVESRLGGLERNLGTNADAEK
jgi:hypothetical protein